jgi:oxalate decarboxylase/phosphoglucose isomerase-like protein (cupin superfamily)
MIDRQPVDTSEPDRLRVGGDELAFRVTGAQSAGALVAVDVTMPAGGGPPALHRHASAEVYRVEAGELAFHIQDDDGTVRRATAAAGEVVHIPGGRAHTIRNESDAEARAYVVFVPGAEIEPFARAAAALAGAGGPPRPEDVMALAARHGIERVGDGAAPAPDRGR